MENTIKEEIFVTVEIDTMQKGMRLYFDYDKNYAELNGRPIELDTHKFYNKVLVPIVSRWEPKMVAKGTIGGMEYYVKIVIKGKEFEYIGKNMFPNNFGLFLELLAEYKLW